MNDRLKELAKGAKHAVEQEGILLDLALERFAHLLLKECLEQMNEVIDECNEQRALQEALGAHWAAARVAMHFGDE